MTDVAIVHDYLTQRGGAERVVLELARAFPDAPIYTSIFAPEATYPGFDPARIRTTPLSRVTSLRRDHRRALPLLAPAFTLLHVDAEVVVCSSSGWAHGVRTSGRKIVYCYTPARWLYQGDRYTPGLSWLRRAALGALAPLLRPWDRRAAHSADSYLVISSVVRDRVRALYGLDAEVVPPPLTFDLTAPRHPLTGVRPPFWLAVARLLPYKNVDAIVEAFRDLPEQRLVVVGDGPEGARLQRLAPDNVFLAGTVEEPELAWLYANCVGTVAAAYEDFGLTPIEAAAFGKPTVALGFGGYRDTIVDGETGILVEEARPDHIRRGVIRAMAHDFDRERLTAQADRFAADRFRAQIRDEVARTAGG